MACPEVRLKEAPIVTSGWVRISNPAATNDFRLSSEASMNKGTSCNFGESFETAVTSSSFNCEKVESAEVGPPARWKDSRLSTEVSLDERDRCALARTLNGSGRCNRVDLDDVLPCSAVAIFAPFLLRD